MKDNLMRKPRNFNQLKMKILDMEKTNHQLLMSVEEYRLQFDNISDVVFIIDTDFNILNISPSVEKLLGYKAEDFIGRSASDLRELFTSESFDRAIANISKLLKGEIIPATTYALLAKDGTLKHIEIHGSPLIHYGQVAGTISVARDITERKRVEDKLLREEQRFRALIEHTSDIIVILNLEGTITYINPAVEQVLGFKPEERIGAKGFELVHPDDMKLLADSFNTLSTDTNSAVIKGEMHLHHKDGSWRTLEAVGSNMVNNNVVEAVIVNYRDITERKKAEFQRKAALEALRKSEDKYRRIAENMSDMVSDIDAEGLFTYISPSHHRILGYKPEDLLGTDTFDNIHPDDKDRVLSVYMEGVITKTDREIEYRYRHADGQYVWIRSSGHIVLDGSGEYIGSIINSSDISERKRMDELIRESERKYRELSIIDDLTQLYNSRYFFTQMEIEIERSNRYGQPLTLLLLDLDRFKKFNDKYGHIEGDYVLSRLGQVIKRCLRDSDSAYRYGGEEFTIMLPMTTSNEGIITAKRIQSELRKEIFSPVLNKIIYVTVSIGLSQYKSKEEIKEFINRVDKLMYQAKKNGRDRICS